MDELPVFSLGDFDEPAKFQIHVACLDAFVACVAEECLEVFNFCWILAKGVSLVLELTGDHFLA